MRTNRDRLVQLSLQGKIKPPLTANPFYVTETGKAVLVPSMGGITYNVKVGDPAFGWAADHVEPGVTLFNEEPWINDGFNTLACIGNEVRVVGGEARGARGFVTGKHSGVDHVMAWFPPEVLDKLVIGDPMQVRGFGQGLELPDYPGVTAMNVDPDLLLAMGIREEDSRLVVPVAAEIPPHLMGSGVGAATSWRGDYDLMTTDRGELARWGLDALRLGDIVLIRDWENTYGRAYVKGAVTVGVVIHGDCVRMGHGPGITTILSCKDGSLAGERASDANIARMLTEKTSG